VFKRVGGWLWPENDTECAKVAFDLGALDIALDECKQFRSAVQAGGNCGVWPSRLARAFKTVYTAEPDPMNFACLAVNAAEPNIFKLQGCFGVRRGTVGFDMPDRNCGAGFAVGKGPIPVLRIDDLGLTDCDLIALDIEGMEADALEGAGMTIDRCHPVILIEEKGHGKRFGKPDGFAGKWLEYFGYKEAGRYARDIIYI